MSYITITSIMDFPVNWTTESWLYRFFLGGPMDGTVTQVFELPWQQPEVINVAKPRTIEELWSMAEGKDDPQPVTGTYRAAECPITIKTNAGRKVVGVTYVWAGWDEAVAEVENAPPVRSRWYRKGTVAPQYEITEVHLPDSEVSYITVGGSGQVESMTISQFLDRFTPRDGASS